MIPQEEYMEKVARKNLDRFLEQGYATAGHNGPHGHQDTPVRNTAHYLIIYSYLYKHKGDEKFAEISRTFFEYLKECQQLSKSGAIQCMITDRFDHLNGLIGQGWVIEALIYYYETFGEKEALEIARLIFNSQKYDWEAHLWRRVELDGQEIGFDPTSNHQVWFAACSYKLASLCNDGKIEREIHDFVLNGKRTFLKTYNDGLLKHNVNIDIPIIRSLNKKKLIKHILTPIRFLNPRKLEPRYIEFGYHIFDLYGLLLLKERYGDAVVFKSKDFERAVLLAKNIDKLDRLNKTREEGNNNVYYYTYNSPAFEWPYVSKSLGFYDEEVVKNLYGHQVALNNNPETDDLSRNNPDIETWNARTYELVRFLELQ